MIFSFFIVGEFSNPCMDEIVVLALVKVLIAVMQYMASLDA